MPSRVTSSQPRGHQPATWFRTTVPAMGEGRPGHMCWRIRKASRSPRPVLVAAATLALAITGLASSPPPAWASPPHATLVTLAPTGPFSSGQLVDVTAAPNRILEPRASLTIEECTAPSNRWSHWQPVCDPRTQQHGRVTTHRNGSLLYPGYPIYALPVAFTRHESARHQPVCDLTHACVLVISVGRHDGDGDSDGDDEGGMVWSLPFFVTPPGADPPPSTPEVPYVLALPLLATAIIGGSVLVRRRSPRGH
jgi:hypothetical protein